MPESENFSERGKCMCFNEYESWTLKSQCFLSQILELVHIYHSNTCSVSVVVSLFCYFSLQWQRQICNFLKMKIFHLGPFWKNDDESVYLTYSFSGYVLWLLGEVTQTRTKSLIIFDANNIYMIFFQKNTNVKRKMLQNQVLPFLEGICPQTNWWLRRVIFLGAACVGLWRILRWTQTSWSVLAWMGPTSTSLSNENLWKSWRKTRE